MAVSLLLASGLYVVGGVFCLAGTQGMNGNEGVSRVFLSFSMLFGVVSLVAAGIGLAPLMSGPDAWWRGVLGFVAGPVFAALGLAFAMEADPPELFFLSVFRRPVGRLLAPMLFALSLSGPPIGGLLALMALAWRRGARPTAH